MEAGQNQNQNQNQNNALVKRWVDTEHMETLRELYFQDPTVRAAREAVGNTLFSAGIQIERQGKRVSHPFEQLLQREWVPFCEEVLDNIYMFGFCPYMTVNKTVMGKKTLVPIVPQFGTYRVEMRVSRDFDQTFHFYPITSFPSVNDKEDTRIKCFVSKYKPSVDCVIRSPVSCLVYSFRVSRELNDMALHVEHLRSHPTLITQSNRTATNGDASVSEMMEYADGDHDADLEQRTYRKNRAQIHAFVRQQDMAKSMNSAGARGDNNCAICPLTGKVQRKLAGQKQTWEDNIFVLPDGQQLAPLINPQCRTDLLDLERARHSLICSVFGVPQGLIMLDAHGQSSSSTSEGLAFPYKMYLRTLRSVGNMLRVFLEQLYSEIYGDTTCEISFPFLPITSIEELLQVGQQGLVSRETLGRHILRTLGLPEADLDIQPLILEIKDDKTSASAALPQKRKRT